MEHKPTEYDYLIKLLVIGEPASGKTWFIRRIFDELIPDVSVYQPLDVDFVRPHPTLPNILLFKNRIPTLIDLIKRKKIKTTTDLESNKILKLQIWKYKQDRFRSVAASWFRGAYGVIITVDVTSPDFLEKLTQYLQIIDRYTMEFTKVLIMATKTDASDRKVNNQEILEVIEQKVASDEYWKEREVQFIETSALKNFNIDQALQMITRPIVRRFLENEAAKPANLNTANKNKNKEKRCILM